MGNAKTLVMIHGSGDSAHVWAGVIERLRWPPERVVALDLPGHGARTDEVLPSPATVPAYTRTVRESIEALRLAHVTLVGHSLGSAITLRLALDAPDMVERIVLVGAGARMRVLPALLEEARTRPEAAARHLLEMGLAPEHEGMLAEYAAQREPAAPQSLYQDLAACDGFDVMDELAMVAQPALVIVGEADRLTPPKYARYLVDHLPHATLVEVPSAGHYLMHEAPDELAASLREWVDAATT